MTDKTDIDIRYDGAGGIVQVLIGVAVGGFAILVAVILAPKFGGGNEIYPMMIFPVFISLGFIIYGSVRLFTKRAMLTLNSEEPCGPPDGRFDQISSRSFAA